MALSVMQMARLSRLLDDALPLDEQARRLWLDALAPENRDLEAALRHALLSEGDEAGALKTLPHLDAGAGSSLAIGGLRPGDRIGPYELVRELGSGGMAQVWLARRADGAFKREVALKLPMQTCFRTDLEQRFSRERDILASLDHPNIARLFDAGFSDNGQPYITLEYVAGLPLTVYADGRRASVRERLALFQQVLSAVQYAHAHGVIHRDLKPSNILVTGEGQVRLLDFGIAKLLTDGRASETELTQLAGRALTPNYAAPEQITGAPITTAADVYGLGVTLYELLTGDRPYRLKRDTRGALEEAIVKADPVAPSRAPLSQAAALARGTTIKKLASALRGDVDTVVMKALKKIPAERYATANAFADDIDRFLHGDVVLAQPDSIVYRTVKFARRHWIGMSATGALIATLVAGLAATSYEARIASEQRDMALQANSRSLTQAAAARLKSGDISKASAIVLEVLRDPDAKPAYAPEAVSVFQEARAADAQIVALTGHTDVIGGADFSSDGRRVATASDDGTARLWDAATGRPILALRGHKSRLRYVAFSPDGRWLATAADDQTARIWSTASGEEVRSLPHPRVVYSATFSADGRRIVTGCADRIARIFDAATGQLEVSIKGHTGPVHSADFSPDGRRVVTSSTDGTARVWDAATGRQLALLSGHTGRLWRARFSPDGRKVVTAAEDQTARIWDSATGQQLAVLRGHTTSVLSAQYLHDGHNVVTASEDGSVRIWDAATGGQLKQMSGYAGRLIRAVPSPDDRQILVVGYDVAARLWNASLGLERLQLDGHTDRVYAAAYSPDGRRIVTASWDKSARIWDSATGNPLVSLLGHDSLVVAASFSSDAQRIVTASVDKTARVWDAATGEPIVVLRGHAGRLWHAAFSPDGRRIVTASEDATARIWDASSGKELQQLRGHKDRVVHAAFSPDGQRIATTSTDKTTRLWDAATGRPLLLLTGHADVVETVEFSRDGRRLVTASDDRSARIWDSATGRLLVPLIGHEDVVSSARFSPDGRRVVTSSFDRTARIWDADTGQQMRVLGGHSGLVQSAMFSPDGDSVVTASDDKTARVWDARTPALQTQLDWAAAAQFDFLGASERFELGLPAPKDVRRWPQGASKCDHLAAAPYDPDRRDRGVPAKEIIADLAVPACEGHEPRSLYQHGRALAASGNLAAARHDFEQAAGRGYRSAGIDLALLSSNPSVKAPDIPQAIGLLEQAWSEGVAVAAFELGRIYEHAGQPGGAPSGDLPGPDAEKAWFWYRKGMEVGEPNALARMAEQSEAAASSEDRPARRNSYLLESFRYYASAVEQARRDDWPDDSARNWRFHRASLARLLAREGMMQQVADSYSAVVRQARGHNRPG